MKNKHLHIAKDKELMNFIYREVKERLVIDNRSFQFKVWTKFIFYFAITTLSYAMLYQGLSTMWFCLSFILYGFISILFAFNFSHDFSHNTVFKSKKLNNICYVAMYTLLGAHAEAWKQRHVNAHHHAPNVEEYDSDLQITNLIRITPHSEYLWFHRFQHFYAPVAYMSYSLFWIFIKDFVLLFSKDEFTKNKNFSYHLVFWIQKCIYITFLLILPILFSGKSLIVVLVGFLLMHLFQSLFLLFTFFMTHHVEATAYPTTNEDGVINTSWLMNQVKSSNDMHPYSEIANFIFGGFNNHIAHHLFPHHHHIYYPKLNRILYEILKKHNIQPNQTTYWGGVLSHLKLLKRRSLGVQY